MKLSLASITLLLTTALAVPAPPSVLPGVDYTPTLTARTPCGGGTGYCSNNHCVCSDSCENMCAWYECGSC